MQTTIQLKNGSRKINVVFWPTKRKVKGAVQIIHGASEYIERYEVFARYLNENGYDVYGNTLKGHGIDYAPINFGFNGKKIVLNDVATISKYISARYQNYFVLGHSMGSLILRILLSKHEIECSGAIICATGYTPRALTFVSTKFLSIASLFAPKKVSKSLNKQVFNFSDGWVVKDEAAMKAYQDDPKCGNDFTMSALNVLVHYARMANARKAFKLTSKIPLLLISGQEDAFGNNGKGVKKIHKLYQKYHVDASYILYPNMKHEILNEKDHLIVFEDVMSFMNLHQKG